jgi:endonuclease/exonuclease/phosphatase (EEP) superfamily protein YafD
MTSHPHLPGTPTPVHAALQLGIGLPLALVRRSRPVPVPAWVADAPRCTVAFANLLFSNPTMDDAVRRLLATDADVIVAAEVTDAGEQAFKRAGAFERWSTHEVHPQPGGYGAALFTRLPVRRLELSDIAGLAAPRATVVVDDCELDVIGVHTQAPVVGWKTRRWNDELAAMAHLETPRPTVAIGDWNAVRWHPPFAALLDRFGWVDAHEALGRGRSLSWRFPPLPIAPLARLDHALLRGDVWPVAVEELARTGSDHHPFVVTLALR